MGKIITAREWKKNAIENGYAENSVILRGDKKANVAGAAQVLPNSQKSILLKNMSWVNTAGYNKVWNNIEGLMGQLKANVASFDQASYEQLIDNIRIDITRRRMEYLDLTQLIDEQITNLNFSKSVSLDEFLPFGAAFKEDNFRGKSVNLIDQKYGATGSVTMQGYSVGWADTLENQLYNMDIFTLQKVLDAVARGFVAKRNDLSVGEIIGKTTDTAWDSSQQQAADSTSGASLEEKYYTTLDKAIEKLTNLKDPQTGQLIRADRINMICYPGNIRMINRAINGQLNNSKGITSNRTALEIDSLIPYYGDTLYVGKEEIAYPGVTKNKAYLYVPGVASYTLQKRGLQQETGRGSVLNLSTDEFAWYFAQTSYRKEFFGSSDTDVNAKVGAGYGYVVEVTLPS